MQSTIRVWEGYRIFISLRLLSTDVLAYCQTFENKSSVPPNPPAVLVEVVVVSVEIGIALAHPPKSSSPETVGGDLAAVLDVDIPQPEPISLAVSVSGIFIMLDGAVEAGAGSGVFHASLPHGSMLLDSMLAVVVTTGLGAGCGSGAGVGFERLKTELMLLESGEDAAGGEVVVGAVVVIGGEERSNRSLEADVGGELGFGAGAVAVFVKLKSRPLDDVDGVRPWGFCDGFDDVVRLSKRPPPVEEMLGEVTLGAAGADFTLAKFARFEKGDGFSCCF